MNTLLSVLDASGDIEIRWDHDDPAEVAKARQAVQDLKAAGYAFFLVDGTPAEGVTDGLDALSCRRVEADGLLPAPSPAEAAAPEAPAPKRRGPRARSESADVRAVAVKPLRGG